MRIEVDEKFCYLQRIPHELSKAKIDRYKSTTHQLVTSTALLFPELPLTCNPVSPFSK